MKKLSFILVLLVLMSTVLGSTALAHGGHGRGHHSGTGRQTTRQPKYAVCNVDGCEEIGAHQHGDTWYCDQSARHSGYAVCTVEGCEELGLHKHDGTYYHCGNYVAGSGCRGGRARR